MELVSLISGSSSSTKSSRGEGERSRNGKWFKGPGGKHIKNYGQQVVPVRTPEGFTRKSTWQVADVRRPLVSASHIFQAGNDLSIGKNEAYIVNRKKKEKVGAQKKSNVYVLDLFVKVPPGAVAPVTYTHSWRLTQSIKLQTEECKRSELRSTAENQLFDGKRSERGRQDQANCNRETAIG